VFPDLSTCNAVMCGLLTLFMSYRRHLADEHQPSASSVSVNESSHFLYQFVALHKFKLQLVIPCQESVLSLVCPVGFTMKYLSH
jgi:hypothetical protein